MQRHQTVPRVIRALRHTSPSTFQRFGWAIVGDLAREQNFDALKKTVEVFNRAGVYEEAPEPV